MNKYVSVYLNVYMQILICTHVHMISYDQGILKYIPNMHIFIQMHTYLYTDELERVRNAQKYFEGDEENLKYSYFYPEVICVYTCIYI